MMLHPLHTDIERPARFTYPFCYEPHPLCLLAADEVQRELGRMDVGLDVEGKMFGVLVVEGTESGCETLGSVPHYGGLGFLAAYSGLLAGRNDWPWFVPPVYDAQQPDGYFKQREREISAINRQLAEMETPPLPLPSEGGEWLRREDLSCEGGEWLSREDLKARRRELSEELQLWLFRQYRVLNARGETKDLVEVWRDYHCSPRIRNRYPLPPGGTGDCCAPKLLQYAYQHGLRPVCMAEFWWGPSPKSDIRHHGRFYPACRGKCKPVLTWMLQGLDVDPDPETLGFSKLQIETVYEDDTLWIINKPSGLLSVPGRIEKYSAAKLVADRCPGALLVHRLDMGTSGLLIAAKTTDAYHHLQQQFITHTVSKQYIALLDGIPHLPSLTSHFSPLTSHFSPLTSHLSPAPADSSLFTLHSSLLNGTIRLPLYSDPLNRPRQVVDYERGKTAVTDYRILAVENGRTRVALFPHTGRTHQLRVHCAHEDGLGCPIVGDELYGKGGGRLLLHAAAIDFVHPATGKAMHVECPPDF